MATHIVTRDSLQALLNRDDRQFVTNVVGRALKGLLDRQTREEANSNTTNEHNGIGFTGADGRSGVLTAKSYIKNGTLQDWQLDRWLKPQKNGYARITKYWKQLDEIAQAKRAA
jgi:hypothetical protein